ncbi:LuxR C-terminal-related transcriptional regulator [Dactylosporangium sp. NPDC049742]|uniref:ATP-binding protein n=1 Tax=Dactylosporangium sp. NPDC049742 TaxID=3154737 RepID=UPI00342A5B1F
MDRPEISPREAEVLAAVREHLSNAQIAHRLQLSVRTVESHVSSLLRKLGAGDRRTLARMAGPAGGPAPAAPRPSGIPGNWTTFVGRARDVETVLDRIGRAGLVTLLGPGGVGKTRLAVAVAEAVAADRPGGVTFVDLVPVRAGFVQPALAGALGVLERPPRSLADAVIDRLRTERPLLVLDTCEHLVDEVGPVVERILADCPGVTVLTTSRQRLGVSGEHLVLVAPLPVGGDAQRLFLDRARAVSPDFAADPALLAEICARLDGVPLAIELAAARSASLGAEGLLAALDDRLRLLTGGRQADARHRSLHDVLQWSHDLLDEPERAMFRRLSVFAGGFDLTAAAAVAPQRSRGELTDLIGRLADKSLLTHRVVPGGRSRWRLLDTVRAFGEQRLADAGEAAEVRRRHLDWAAATAQALAPDDPDDPGDWVTAFDEVVDDLRVALARTGPAPDGTAHRLAAGLARLAFARGYFAEAREHYQAAAVRAGDAVQAVRDLRRAADAAVIVSDGPAALRLLLEAAERAGATGDARATALAHAVIVAVRYAADFAAPVTRPVRARLLRQATEATDGTDQATAAVLAAARAWHELSGPATSATLARIAVRAARRTADPVLVALCLDALGTAAVQMGRPLRAHRVAELRIKVVSALAAHDPAGAAEITDAHHVAVSAALAAGDLPAARTAVRRAQDDDPAGGHPYLAAPRLIRVLALSGRFDEAVEAARTLWDNWVRDGRPVMAWMSSALAAVALVHGLRGDGQGDLWRSRALEVAGHDDPRHSGDLAAVIAFADARTAVHTGDTDRAAALVERCTAGFPERWWEGYARAAGAELAVLAGLPDAAGTLARIAPVASEHRWAAAVLTRARGRLTGDPAVVRQALAQWDRLDSRFERACTLVLLPGQEAAGRGELTALGCPPPGRAGRAPSDDGP